MNKLAYDCCRCQGRDCDRKAECLRFATLNSTADKISAGIITGHDWPNSQDELIRLQAAKLLREAADEIERLRAAIPDGWQPIETAPTNGEAILIANGNGVWAAKYKAVYQSGYKPESPWMSLMLNKDHIPARLRHGKPTHWMPLPAAPKPGATK